MKTKRQFVTFLTSSTVALLVSLAITTAIVLGFSRGPELASPPQREPLMAEPSPVMVASSPAPRSLREGDTLTLEDTYVGAADLRWAAGGVYSDTLTPPDELLDLGTIDLGFLVHCDQETLSGYISLTSTLVFTEEHTIFTTQSVTTPVSVGPAVQGLCTGSTLEMESEPFYATMGDSKPITRQFYLTGTQTPQGTFVGEYRETLWGYGQQPVTIVGDMKLELLKAAGYSESGVPTSLEVIPGASVLAVQGSTAVTATLRDLDGDLITSTATITFTSSLGEVTPSVIDTASGVATTTFTAGDTPGTAIITATNGTLVDVAPVTIVASGVAATLQVTTADSTLAMQGSTAVTATLRDLGGELFTGAATITFTSKLGNVIPAVINTNTGIATTTFTAEDTPGTAVITATDGVLVDTATFTIQMPEPVTYSVYLPTVLR